MNVGQRPWYALCSQCFQCAWVFWCSLYITVNLSTLLTRFCHVSFLMLSKLMGMTKGLHTFLTFVGFLSCVNSLMFKKAWSIYKVLPTFLTFVRGFTSVNSFMFKRSWSIYKALPTFLKFIGVSPVWICSCLRRPDPYIKAFPLSVHL